MTTSEKIAVMQAYENGKPIQYNSGGRWRDWIISQEPTWDWARLQYRIKPEPKLRPYKDAKEFLQAQKEHGIYVRLKNIDVVHYTLPTDVDDKEIMFADVSYTYESCMNNLYWQDGAPCGVME